MLTSKPIGEKAALVAGLVDEIVPKDKCAQPLPMEKSHVTSTEDNSFSGLLASLHLWSSVVAASTAKCIPRDDGTRHLPACQLGCCPIPMLHEMQEAGGGIACLIQRLRAGAVAFE